VAERLVTIAELREQLERVLALVANGETVVVVDEVDGDVQRRHAVLIADAVYQQLRGHGDAQGDHTPVEAKVGGVAGGLVAGAGTTISSLTGNADVAKGARRFGRRLGRALAVGLDALGDDKGTKGEGATRRGGD